MKRALKLLYYTQIIAFGFDILLCTASLATHFEFAQLFNTMCIFHFVSSPLFTLMMWLLLTYPHVIDRLLHKIDELEEDLRN